MGICRESIYYNMKCKSLWSGHEISSLNLEQRAETPKFELEEMKKYGDENRENLIYVIPRE